MDKFLPMHYHLEVFENSLENDPSFSAFAAAPFGAMSVGDTFETMDHGPWTLDRSANGTCGSVCNPPHRARSLGH